MNAKKFTLLALLAVATAMQMAAKPARPGNVTVTQPDGTQLTVALHGDEYFHYMTTPQGAFVVQGEDGFYRYASLDANNVLTATQHIATDAHTDIDASLPTINDEGVRARLLQRHSAARMARSEKIVARKAQPARAGKPATQGEDVHGLVILVEFKDVKFKSTSTQQAISDLMNEEGNSYMGAIGSARDYFIAQSYGQFNPIFDVVGPVTLDNNMSYYGGNDRYGNDQRPEEVIIEACQKASAQGLCNMADYDLDGDGWVDLVYVIYAGYSESSGASSNTIWPHMWYVYQGAGTKVSVDGVYLDMYACSSELTGTSGSDMDGIGSFCHEYSHTLGLPDFYDTYGYNFGMDSWSIMDFGCYAEDGRIPIGYTAYERMFCGWLTLDELDEPSTIVAPYLGDNAKAYRISSTNNNQYFTLETRLQKGWDVGLPSEGLMIVSVDYNESDWTNNTVNNSSSRQRMTIVPADNTLSHYSLTGDLWPYGNKNAFTSTSSPAMKIYNTTITGKPVENITFNSSAGVVTFDFMGGAPNVTLDAPVATSAGNVTQNGFTAYWSPVTGASSYTLSLTKGNDEWFYEYITVTHIDITDLSQGTYVYKVKAVNGTNESAYSNEITVEVGSTAVLTQRATASTIYAAQGNIVIESNTPCQAIVYNAQGMTIGTLHVDGSLTYTPSRSGLYFVRCNGTTTKVIVK